MRKFLISALVLGLLFGVMSTASAEPSWSQRWETARFRSLEGSDKVFTDREVIFTIRAVFPPSQRSTALRVASCESGFEPTAYNSYSGASGVFQHLKRYWAGRVSSLTKQSGPLGVKPAAGVFNARANVIVAARMVGGGDWSDWECY